MYERYFLRYINANYGESTCAKVQKAFKHMKLPMPTLRDQDYRVTSDAGLMTFLTPFGCVARLMDKKYEIPDSDHVLQPLGIIDVGGMYLYIFPGVEMDNILEDQQTLQALFASQSLDFWDVGLDNIGTLSVKTDECPNGHIVVLDPAAVKNDFNQVSSIQRHVQWAESFAIASFPKIRSESCQDRLYGSLRHTFEQSYLKNKMHIFWKICTEMKKKGILSTPWETNYHRDIDDISHRYKNRLAESSLAHLIT